MRLETVLRSFVVLAALALAVVPAHAQTGGVTLRSMGLCLDVASALTAPGTHTMAWSCHGDWNQRWSIGGDGTIRTPRTGLCLSVEGGVATSGARVIMQPCTNAPGQHWTIGGGAIRSELGLCLDVSGGAPIAGASAIAYGCHGGPNQVWAIE